MYVMTFFNVFLCSGSCLAYIGPGLLYLGVHGGRFLELADDFFKVPKENANEQTHQMASETTSLVENSDSEGEDSQRSLDGWHKVALWYLGGMPLWTSIAELGHKRVMAHAQSLAAKNTLEHNRIGGVDLKGKRRLANQELGGCLVFLQYRMNDRVSLVLITSLFSI